MNLGTIPTSEFLKVMNFSKASWQIQLKTCHVLTSYQMIEIQMFVYTNKRYADNIQQIKVYFAYQAIKYSLIQDSKGQGSLKECSISKACSRCVKPTARTKKLAHFNQNVM